MLRQHSLSWMLGAVAVLAGAACGGGSKPTPSEPVPPATEQPAPIAASTATQTQPGDCPVDQSLCDFARQAQSDLQRGDPWAFMWSPSDADDPITGIGGALLRQLAAGTGTARLIGIGCPDVPDSKPCERYFSLVFSALGEDQPAKAPGFGMALVGLDRGRGGVPEALGLSLPGSPEAVLKGGRAGSCGFADGSVGPGCVIYLYTAAALPDFSLGIEAAPVKVGPDVPFPANMSIVVANCANKGAGGCWEVARFRRLTSGEIEKRVLFTPPSDGDVTGVTATFGGTLYLSLCRGPDCFMEGPALTSTTDFLRSTDGGVTWAKVAESTGRWWARGAIGEEALSIDFGGQQSAWRAVPSLRPLPRPASSSPDSMPVDLGGAVAWVDPRSAALLDVNGKEEHLAPLALAPRASGFPTRYALGIEAYFRAPQRPPVYVLDVDIGPVDPVRHRLNRYLAVGGGFPSSPSVTALLRLDGQEVNPVAWLGESPILLVYASWQRPAQCLGAAGLFRGQGPALLDTETGILSLIADPFLCLGANVQAVAVYGGPFAEVKTPGDCLNVRETPMADGRILGCFADGVLLSTDGATVDGQSRTYLHVKTPDGREGWAAEKFLTR